MGPASTHARTVIVRTRSGRADQGRSARIARVLYHINIRKTIDAALLFTGCDSDSRSNVEDYGRRIPGVKVTEPSIEKKTD